VEESLLSVFGVCVGRSIWLNGGEGVDVFLCCCCACRRMVYCDLVSDVQLCFSLEDAVSRVATLTLHNAAILTQIN
jgi:hypothetical protein